MNSLGSLSLPIQKVCVQHPISQTSVKDCIAVEEPLEIRLSTEGPEQQRTYKTLTITMRTPGHDEDLALGFLFSEKIINRREDVIGLFPCGPVLNQALSQNIIRVDLGPDTDYDPQSIARNFITNSSCGVCGKTSLEFFRNARILKSQPEDYKSEHQVSPSLLIELPDLLRKYQSLFNSTGGLHASALFTLQGELIGIREDVGRHNALDKLIGLALSKGLLPLNRAILLVSGRVSFELVQKATLAGIRILAAVGAPSSLAIEMAKDSGMTLLGFLRKDHFNVYCGAERIKNEAENS